MELAAEDGAGDLFLVKNFGFAGATRSCPVGCGAMRCGGQVQRLLDCRAQEQRCLEAGSDAVGESFVGQISETDELYLGGWEKVNRNERGQVRVTAVSGIDDSTVGTTDWKGFGKQD